MSGTLSTRKSRSLFPRGGGREGLSTLRNEMENLLSNIFEEESDGWFGGTLKPSVDLSETDNAVEVRMDLPGVKAEEINIHINNNLLTVSGERKEEKETKDKTYHRVERRTGSFSRSFGLPCAVAEDEVAADYQDGVLNITLPKAEEAQGRKIKVKG